MEIDKYVGINNTVQIHEAAQINYSAEIPNFISLFYASFAFMPMFVVLPYLTIEILHTTV